MLVIPVLAGGNSSKRHLHRDRDGRKFVGELEDEPAGADSRRRERDSGNHARLREVLLILDEDQRRAAVLEKVAHLAGSAPATWYSPSADASRPHR
jgi:hypothetical protein